MAGASQRSPDEQKIEGPRWDLASEYPGADSAELNADLRALSELLRYKR